MNGTVTYLSLEDAERQERAQHASQNGRSDKSWPEPMPLVRPLGQAEPFPVEALGPVLGNAAKGIANIVQCPEAIAACSVLAVASLAAQPHADVLHPATGRKIPVSLYLLTIAESGERKSAADTEALSPVKAQEKTAVDDYKLSMSRWKNQHEAWEATRAAVKKKAKGNWHDLEKMLQDLGEEPKVPLKPYITVSEPTFEGLAKLLGEGQSSMGLFSAEGGGFLGGHAMRDESRLRALTGLSELWDGSPLKRTRAGDGALHLLGRRLSLHLMVQPSVAPMLLADDMANGQGFLSRLLVCAPLSLQGQRFQREPQTWARPSIATYSDAILALLQRKPRIIGDGEIDPEALHLTKQATSAWRDFADDMERGLVVDGISSGIRGLRNKVPEMALRIAGTLAVVDEETEITLGAFERGKLLASFFLTEAKRLYEASMTSPEIARASKLLRWLLERGGDCISLRDIMTYGPAFLRETEVMTEITDVLVAHGLCRLDTVETGGRPSKRLAISPFAKDVF